MEEQVVINQEAIDEILRDKEGPVGDLMRELADQMAVIARSKARVLNPKNTWGPRSSAYRTDDGSVKSPGYLKRNITTIVGNSVSNDGYVFGGVNAPGNPAFFLEAPAEQMHDKYPFLSTALDSLWLD